MADFITAYSRTAKTEGGFTDDPDDNGNWTGGRKGLGSLVGTNYGITARDLMWHLRRVPTVDDMRNISIDTVKEIYRANYWNVVHGDEINDQEIANDLYDAAVNMGTGAAIILACRAQGLPDNRNMTTTLLSKLNNKS